MLSSNRLGASRRQQPTDVTKEINSYYFSNELQPPKSLIELARTTSRLSNDC